MKRYVLDAKRRTKEFERAENELNEFCSGHIELDPRGGLCRGPATQPVQINPPSLRLSSAQKRAGTIHTERATQRSKPARRRWATVLSAYFMLASCNVCLGQLFWDLRFQIINAPTTGAQCGTVNWAVRVTNAGNITSENVCFFTGIGPVSGAGNWLPNLGQVFFSSGNVPPGGSSTFTVANYAIR